MELGKNTSGLSNGEIESLLLRYSNKTADRTLFQLASESKGISTLDSEVDIINPSASNIFRIDVLNKNNYGSFFVYRFEKLTDKDGESILITRIRRKLDIEINVKNDLSIYPEYDIVAKYVKHYIGEQSYLYNRYAYSFGSYNIFYYINTLADGSKDICTLTVKVWQNIAKEETNEFTDNSDKYLKLLSSEYMCDNQSIYADIIDAKLKEEDNGLTRFEIIHELKAFDFITTDALKFQQFKQMVDTGVSIDTYKNAVSFGLNRIDTISKEEKKENISLSIFFLYNVDRMLTTVPQRATVEDIEDMLVALVDTAIIVTKDKLAAIIDGEEIGIPIKTSRAITMLATCTNNKTWFYDFAKAVLAEPFNILKENIKNKDNNEIKK